MAKNIGENGYPLALAVRGKLKLTSGGKLSLDNVVDAVEVVEAALAPGRPGKIRIRP